MNFHVVVLPEARDDVFEIYQYVTIHDSIASAETLLQKIEEKFNSLKQHPERGHEPPELRRVYVHGFREIHYKPYRIIYQITGGRVYVYATLDGRRELDDLLVRRLYR